MAAISFPFSDIEMIGTITLWNKFALPVFSISSISTEDDFNNFILQDNSYFFGSEMEDIPLSWIIGTFGDDFRQCAGIFDEYKSSSFAGVISDEQIEYGVSNQYIIHRVVNTLGKASPVYPSQKADRDVTISYRNSNSPHDENFTLFSVGFRTISTQPAGNIESTLYQSFNGGAGGFIKVGQKYARVRVHIQFVNFPGWGIPSPLWIESSNVNNPTRGSDFFGCNAYTLLDISDIAGGTASIDVTPTNPFAPLPPSQPGALPPGTFDDTSDPIPDSPLPTLSAANTGFTRIYNPTLSQVQDLANYLWTDESVINTIWNHVKQFFEDPMQAIIGFNLVPCPVPDAGSKEFALMFIKTGVTMNVAANQFVDVECGSVELKRYYGSALDQSPYTKVSCFLPFIGVVSLNTDEVMGTTLSVRYRIDIVSGSCVAKILVDNNVLYQYSGHCAINIPISSSDFSSYVSAAISVAKLSIGYGLAGAFDDLGLTQDPVSQTSTTSTLTTTESNTVRNPSTGRQITSGTKTTTQVLEEQKDTTTTKASYDGLTPANVANTVGQIMGSKPHVEHSGSFNGNTGYLGVRRPYLIIERPNMCLPENYQSLNGFPSMITMPLGNCKGYTRVQQVQLTGMQGASINEQSEIQSFLKSGVIF